VRVPRVVPTHPAVGDIFDGPAVAEDHRREEALKRLRNGGRLVSAWHEHRHHRPVVVDFAIDLPLHRRMPDELEALEGDGHGFELSGKRLPRHWPWKAERDRGAQADVLDHRTIFADETSPCADARNWRCESGASKVSPWLAQML
jgi:hypothetical protein